MSIVIIIIINAACDKETIENNEFPDLPGFSGEYDWYVSSLGKDTNFGYEKRYPFKTIQHAIDLASSGQIIRVANGTYIENIDFRGKDIRLIGNPTSPKSVIIDGNKKTSTVKMTNREPASTMLCGFTITGGNAHDVTLGNGGGIHLYNNANPILTDLIITGNYAANGPAIAALHGSSPTIQNTVIYGNDGLRIHQTVRFHNGCHVIMSNVTIGYNSGVELQASIGLSYSSDLTIRNSIVYNPNTRYEISLSNSENYLGCISTLSIHYCNIKYGSDSFLFYPNKEQGKIYGLEGIQDADPVFLNPKDGKYQLAPNSPCIDAGDPSETWNDINFPPAQGTKRNDMGAYGWKAAFL